MLGRTLATHEIVITDEAGHRLSTVRMTNILQGPLAPTESGPTARASGSVPSAARPPSTGMTAPVTQDDSSDSRKAMTRGHLADGPDPAERMDRGERVVTLAALPASEGIPVASRRSVAMLPRATQFARMPCGP